MFGFSLLMSPFLSQGIDVSYSFRYFGALHGKPQSVPAFLVNSSANVTHICLLAFAHLNEELCGVSNPGFAKKPASLPHHSTISFSKTQSQQLADYCHEQKKALAKRSSMLMSID
ncbi:hypothetical protein B0T21DRAFT_121637 [Apiosordaria backusii]|uniref:Uncharacterized protein n=1 Tax=Apiosordaria backusii TaxID=314023 RepID=A0AA40EMB3_9PEZI|nr:hypothetical protein B0T21DRAFT_121637 [Apiosordaria backusii]